MTLLALCVACSRSDDRPSTGNEVQAEFNSQAELRQSAWVDQLQTCAVYNGVATDAIRTYLDALADHSISTADTLTSLDQLRQELETNGSGLIASIDISSREIVDTPDLAAEDVRIFDVGPIKDPASGLTYAQGRASWSTDAVSESKDFLAGIEFENDYSMFLEQYLDGNLELTQLDADWSRCMAEKGFAGLGRRGDQYQQIVLLQREVRAGSMTTAEALETDIRISLANFDCHLEVNGEERNRAVYDAAAQAYFDQVDE